MRYRIIIEKSKEIIIEETKLDLSKNIIIKKKRVGWHMYYVTNGGTQYRSLHTPLQKAFTEKKKKNNFIFYSKLSIKISCGIYILYIYP